MTSFTQQLWRSIDPIYQAIVVHPFLVGLTDGTLPEEAFRFYVVQDALYLQDYARCLALAAAKAPRETWCELFADHAKVALVVERALHESFFAAWGLSPDEIAGTPYAPTNLAYTSYLLRVAYERQFEEVIGALLPCYWIYWKLASTWNDPVRRTRCIRSGSTPMRRRSTQLLSRRYWMSLTRW
jgi:thiaminase/transcriptional activator TenA